MDQRYPFLDAFFKIIGPFLIYFNTWGLLLSYGTFQRYYGQNLLREFSPSTISWIGTLSIFLLLLCGSFSGPAHDQGYQRCLLVSGHFLILLAVFMLSLSSRLYEVFLTQGVCFGLGSGLLYVPSIAGVSRTFTRHRALAIGIAMSGGSIGGIVFSIMLERLFDRVSFAWAIRILGFVLTFTSIVTLITMLPEPVFRAPRRRALVDPAAFRDLPFMAFSVGGFFNLLAYYLPFLYIPLAAVRVGADDRLQIYLIAIINGASFFGRIIPAKFADKFGVLRSFATSLACAAVVLFCWPAVSTVTGLIVWCCFWGFFSGVLIVMPGAVTAYLAPSPDLIGTWLGTACTISGIGFLIGGPIGGAIVSGGSLTGLQIFAGSSMLCAAALNTLAAFVKERRMSKADGTEPSTCPSVYPKTDGKK